MANVYSYLRFSSLKQKSGTSADRQMDYARRWAADNGMVLDESLTMRDEGLSAYHQKHIKSGALGAFLSAIHEGRIPRGSVLIVEGLDRLSRAEPILAQAQMAQIINADITVVTAADGKRYNRDGLKANPMDLVYSLLVMIRAHEESETKSQRARAALRKHCEAWGTDSQRPARIGRAPHWLRRVDGEWRLIEALAAGILAALAMFRRGWGHARIFEAMQRDGQRLTGSAPNSNQLYRIIRNPALMGAREMRIGDDVFRLEKFYPALISPEEFAELQMLMAQRARTGGAVAKAIPGVITGAGLAWCGYCGGAMAANNIIARRRADGSLSDGNRRIACTCHTTKKPCPYPASSSVAPIEQAIMAFCAEQMNLSALLAGNDRQAPARARLAEAKAAVDALEGQLSKVTEALLAADDVAPLVFVRKARELEGLLRQARQEQSAAENEVTATARAAEPGLASAWAALREGVRGLDYEARLMARQLIRDTFERIVIYSHGLRPARGTPEALLLLKSKAGVTRLLTIDRRSGEWRATDDFLR